MLQLDYRDRRPLHEQIKEKIKTLIITGVLQPDERIPSVRELAQLLTVNPNTIQKAYKDLEAEGFIYSIRAKGSFVTPRDRSAPHPRLEELMRELERNVAELMYLNVPMEQLLDTIRAIYKKGGLNE
ncbi:MAG: GntR family transcriptional regulator [Moorella sp. (in: firmicutes)]|jgi:GntR family transcriptional regulator|uniref:GntR family transcriptional regulator n=1 Tax=unclassified Neomoorella TaxID=2676739 RepID=UPI0010FFAEFA|nr:MULTISPECIES: GntR family transcriptional regulator [unclassified Moorella (in: firmicutes)]MDK2815587.1 GntR family transcriptional regulator [Moorella sp. (in: firmicutes)]GEA15140.1 GntR family transcriptional regulator [Moorella sp. E308F]GEA16948.1 GntR family transcriptional regulator [Moorella sp. E306M]